MIPPILLNFWFYEINETIQILYKHQSLWIYTFETMHLIKHSSYQNIRGQEVEQIVRGGSI